MSALHRLKAYFGMVPAEEFDPAEFNAAEFDSYHPDYRSGSPEPGDDSQGHNPGCGSAGIGSGFATRVGHHAAPTMHSTRSPSWTMEHRAADSRARESRATGLWAPVRGSLAIDETASNARSTVHQPVAPHRVTPAPRTDPLAEDTLAEAGANPLTRIVTLHPHNYNEARPIGERYREGNPVIMNLTEMEDRDAKRLVDFAAGLAFALRGSIDKVTNKVFLLSPPNVDVSAEDRRRIAEGRFFG
ncbi:MAG: cell division protein SepF [Pseudonocardiaceae bacterium]